MALKVYRVGDLDKFKRKADSLYQMRGRSTGYFGTGYYFCTRPEYCCTMTRDKDPLYRLTLKEGIKLAYGTQKLHEYLKMYTRFAYNFPICKNDEALKADRDFAREVKEHIPFYEDTKILLGSHLKKEYEDWADEDVTWKEWFDYDYKLKKLAQYAEGTEVSEVADILRSENPDFDRIDQLQKEHELLFDYDRLDGLRDLKFRAVELLAINLGTTPETIMSITEDFYEIYKDFYKDGFLRIDDSMTEEDSASTFLLKSLGYEGVFPDEECDNTTYGGVVFELEDFTYERIADVAKDYIKN